MRTRKLTAQQAVKMWRAFDEAHGREQMTRSYGWEEHPPTGLRLGEHVFVFGDHVDKGDGAVHAQPTVVGWGSIQLNTKNADDDEAAVSVGVFPDYQRRGYAQKIYKVLLKRAEELGADYASQSIFTENAAQLARVMRLASHDKCGRGCDGDGSSGWIHCGSTWLPHTLEHFIYPFAEEDKPKPKGVQQ